MWLRLPNDFVMVLIGASGAGKSTLAQALAAMTGAAVVSYDAHQRAMPGDDGRQSVTAEALAAAWKDLDTHCAAGVPVIVDGTHCQESRRRMVRAIAARYELPAIAIVLHPPLQTCLDRQSLRERQVPADDIALQHTAIRDALADLPGERYTAVVHLSTAALASLLGE